MTQASGGSGDKAERPVQRLPLNVVQQLKRDPSSGRYGRSDLMDVKEKQDLLYSVQEENMSLKKTNVKLAEQVKQLGVRFGQIQKEMQREGYVVDKPASQKEVERLHKALNDGFTGTSASSSSQPWVPATGRSKSPGPGGGGPKSPGVTKQTRRAVTGTGMLRNRTALSPGGRGPSPERSGVARMLVEETEALRKQIGDLKDKNERLTNQMEGVMSARGNKGVSAVEVAFYREQLDDKEQRIKQLQKSLDEDRDSFHKERKEMTATVNRLEKEKLAVESDLRHALALGDETENASLHRKVKESDDMNKKLMEKINSLTSNAFISTADTRVASAKRLERLEEELVEKQKALEGAIADKQKVTFEITEMKNKVTAAEEKYKTTWEENERIRIRLEEREKQAKAVEEQLQVLRDSLPPEERAAVEKSLSLALTSSVVPAAFASSQVERGATSVPSKSDVGSIEGLTKVVSQLRREKADLAQEMTALQNILRRESEINAELKTLHQYDLADMQTKSEAMLADREKWERLAKSRETKVKDLQKQIRQLEQVQVERDDDVISEAGFSDISADMQQSSENNALDLVVNSAKIEFKVLSQHFFPNMPIFLAENSLMTNVLIDFYEFDTVSSRTASGLEPRYDSIITCSPFVMNEQAIKFFNTGAIRFSLQAFAIPQQQQQGQNPALAATQGPPVVVGEAILPLVHLLNCTPLDPNPMVSGTLKFVSKKDPNTTIAHLSYKMKLRFSVLDLLHNFQHQRNKDELSLQMAKPEFDPALVDQVKDNANVLDQLDSVLDNLEKRQWEEYLTKQREEGLMREANGFYGDRNIKGAAVPKMPMVSQLRTSSPPPRFRIEARLAKNAAMSPETEGLLPPVPEKESGGQNFQNESDTIAAMMENVNNERERMFAELDSERKQLESFASDLAQTRLDRDAQLVRDLVDRILGTDTVPPEVKRFDAIYSPRGPPQAPGKMLKAEGEQLAVQQMPMVETGGVDEEDMKNANQEIGAVGGREKDGNMFALMSDLKAEGATASTAVDQVVNVPRAKAADEILNSKTGPSPPVGVNKISMMSPLSLPTAKPDDRPAVSTPRVVQSKISQGVSKNVSEHMTPRHEENLEFESGLAYTPRRNSASEQWGQETEKRKSKTLEGAPAMDNLPTPRRSNSPTSASDRWGETQQYLDNPAFAQRYFRERSKEEWEQTPESARRRAIQKYNETQDWQEATKILHQHIQTKEEALKRVEERRAAVVAEAQNNPLSQKLDKMLQENQ